MSFKDKEAARAYARKWYAKNAKKENARTTKYRAENKDLVVRLAAEWRAKNKEYPKEWAKKNRDRMREADRRWAQAHPEKVRIKARRRRAVKKKIGGDHTIEDINRIKAAQGSKCAYCQDKLKPTLTHVDHIIPLNLGGHNGPTNLQLLCASCNLSKGRYHPLEFARRIGRLL